MCAVWSSPRRTQSSVSWAESRRRRRIQAKTGDCFRGVAISPTTLLSPNLPISFFHETPDRVIGPDGFCARRSEVARPSPLQPRRGAACGRNRSRLEDGARMRALLGELSKWALTRPRLALGARAGACIGRARAPSVQRSDRPTRCASWAHGGGVRALSVCNSESSRRRAAACLLECAACLLE
jgi:hypothetical protein